MRFWRLARGFVDARCAREPPHRGEEVRRPRRSVLSRGGIGFVCRTSHGPSRRTFGRHITPNVRHVATAPRSRPPRCRSPRASHPNARAARKPCRRRPRSPEPRSARLRGCASGGEQPHQGESRPAAAAALGTHERRIGCAYPTKSSFRPSRSPRRTCPPPGSRSRCSTARASSSRRTYATSWASSAGGAASGRRRRHRHFSS